MSMDLPGVEPLLGDWPFRGDPPRRSRGVCSRRGRQGGRTPLLIGVISVVILAAAAGVLVRVLTVKSPARVPAAAAATPGSELFSVLAKTAGLYPGDLRMSACRTVSPTNEQCDNSSAFIAKVSFVTYPSLAVLYNNYRNIVHSLTKTTLSAVQNSGACGPGAPDPTGESSWNEAGQEPTGYSVDQLQSGNIPTSLAMGRVFCSLTANGRSVIVWTQNSGHLIGYATGAAGVSHLQVWNWFGDVHRHITFPVQPLVISVSASPTVSATSAP